MHKLKSAWSLAYNAPGELLSGFITTKLLHDFRICNKMLHAASYEELIALKSEKVPASFESYDPDPTTIALNKALKQFYLILEQSLKDQKYYRPNMRDVQLAFQQALLCLIAVNLGRKDAKAAFDTPAGIQPHFPDLLVINIPSVLQAIDANKVFEYAQANDWLTVDPQAVGAQSKALQSIMIEIVKYHHNFMHMPANADNKTFASFIASINVIKGVSEAFSPEIDIPFSQRIALAILTFLSKKDIPTLLPVIEELNRQDDSEAILHFICCCLSERYLQNFSKNKDSSINNRMLFGLACVFITFSAMITSGVYMCTNIALSTLFLYFAILSISSISAIYLSLRYIVGIDLNDYRRTIHPPAPLNRIIPEIPGKHPVFSPTLSNPEASGATPGSP